MRQDRAIGGVLVTRIEMIRKVLRQPERGHRRVIECGIDCEKLHFKPDSAARDKVSHDSTVLAQE